MLNCATIMSMARLTRAVHVQGYQVLKTSMRDNDPEVRHYSTEALKYLEHYKFTPGAPLSPKKADA